MSSVGIHLWLLGHEALSSTGGRDTFAEIGGNAQMSGGAENQRKYLKDYKPAPFTIPETELFFDIQNDFCLVKAKLKVMRKSANADLVLDGKNLKLVQIKLDGQVLPPERYELHQESLVIKNSPDEFWLETWVEINPKNNTALEGIYVSQGTYCSQCEAEGFRRITYFLDRPDNLSQFVVTIEAEKQAYPVMLSNGNKVSSEVLANGRHRVQWRDPFPKPCYLFALVAGNLGAVTDHHKTPSGRDVELFVYAKPGMQKKSLYALDCLKRVMSWEEKTFGLEYDLDSYMIVAIDDFNAGAMENKGLNIFNSRLVLADPDSASTDDYEYIDSVIAHEYLHNWSGNRVTLRDWFQLSLKEGLTVYRDQEYTSDCFSRSVKRIEDIAMLKSRQFLEDEGPTAHPVRPESFVTIDNFFTPTIYEKGAEVLRVLKEILGAENFNRGLKHYFKKHDGQAVIVEDLLKCMEDTNSVRLDQFFLWYQQAGLPRLNVSWSFDANAKMLDVLFSQDCPPTPDQLTKKPMTLPVSFAILSAKGEVFKPELSDCSIDSFEVSKKTEDGLTILRLQADSAMLNLTKQSQHLRVKNVTSFKTLSLLRGLSCPVKLQVDYSEEDLFFLFAHDTDPYNLWECSQTIYLRTFKEILRQIQKDQAPSISPQVIGVFKKLLTNREMDPAFKSFLFSPPTDAFLVQQLEAVDPKSFFRARRELRSLLARGLGDDLRASYDELHKTLLNVRDPGTFGVLKLKNQLLSFLGYNHLEKVWEQFSTSQQMTDQERSLQILAKFEGPQFLKAADLFFEQWKDEPVVLNKWFAAYARSHRKDSFDKISSLTRHPKFHIKNPNNVYSLLRTFGRENIVVFHDPDLETYEFFGQMIGEVDEKNPIVAARLMEVFQSITKFPKAHRERVVGVVKLLSEKPSLSKNLREILQKIQQIL